MGVERLMRYVTRPSLGLAEAVRREHDNHDGAESDLHVVENGEPLPRTESCPSTRLLSSAYRTCILRSKNSGGSLPVSLLLRAARAHRRGTLPESA